MLASHDHGHVFCLDKALDRTFKQAVKANIADAIKEIVTLRLMWPKLCTALNTFKAARLVLNGGESLIGELGHHGVLHETETGRLLDAIAEAKSRLHTLSPLLALPAAERLAFFPEDAGKTYSQLEIATAMAQISPMRKSFASLPTFPAADTAEPADVEAGATAMEEEGTIVDATPKQEVAI